MVTLDEALTALTNQGFKINAGRGAVVKDGMLHIPVNGQLRSSAEIIAAVTPGSKDVWAFTVAENNTRNTSISSMAASNSRCTKAENEWATGRHCTNTR
jgi:hypothetical protein